MVRYHFLSLIGQAQDRTYSSAKDQLTGVAVAVKKIMKPFSTPVLAKRTYRELKLLKHIQHENVCPAHPANPPSDDPFTLTPTDYQFERRFYFTARGSVSTFRSALTQATEHPPRYFVTELLGTDLHRLLTSRPLEKQFIQYFLYQILVRCPIDCAFFLPLSCDSERSEIRAFCWRRAP